MRGIRSKRCKFSAARTRSGAEWRPCYAEAVRSGSPRRMSAHHSGVPVDVTSAQKATFRPVLSLSDVSVALVRDQRATPCSGWY